MSASESPSAATCGMEISHIAQNITIENFEISQLLPESWGTPNANRSSKYCNVLTLSDSSHITLNNIKIQSQQAQIISQPLITSKNNAQIKVYDLRFQNN